MLSPKYLFDDDPELTKLAQQHGVAGDSWKSLKLDELRVKLLDDLKSVKESPKSSLVQEAGNLKRDSGLFSAWVNCSVFATVDKYLYIFDMENDYKPTYTFDLMRTQAKKVEGEKSAFEITQTKKGKIVGEPPSVKTVRLMAENEADMNRWIACVSGATKIM